MAAAGEERGDGTTSGGYTKGDSSGFNLPVISVVKTEIARTLSVTDTPDTMRGLVKCSILETS